MKHYPLVFSFRDMVAGNGFVAHVIVDGRVLLVEEDDEDIWMFGVQPGCVAGGDKERRTAFAEFKNNYLGALYDIAAEASSFADFKKLTEQFFQEVNEPNARDWTEALRRVREAGICLSDLPTVNADLCPPSISVEEVVPEKIKSNANEFSELAKAA